MASTSVGARGISGKIVPTLFLSVFLGFGSWFTYLMIQGFIHQFQTYSWPQLSCTVISSSVEEHPGASDASESYIFHVQYRWETDGAAGTSDVYRSGYTGSSDVGDALRLARTHAPGAQVPCWVNPEEADSARLRLEPAWNALLIFFPLIFVAVGAGGIWAVWTREKRTVRKRTSISSRAKDHAFRPGCLIAFFAIFLFAGLAFLVPFFLIPAYQGWSAGHWLEVPCILEYSEVRSHTGDDSTTYSLDVLYSYSIDGVGYKSSRYDFFSGSDSSYGPRRAFVDQNPAGTVTTCYVDPDEPLNAVINRDYRDHVWWGLLPLVFVLVGGGGLAWGLISQFGGKRLRAGAQDFSGAWHTGSSSLPGESYGYGPSTLEPKCASIWVTGY